MRVLLLGGTGFIGDALSSRLRAAGADVVTASRSARADLPFDATDPASLTAVLATPFDTVVNLAGAGLTAGTADADVMRAVNTDLPVHLLRELAKGPQSTALLHAASSTERVPGQSQDESEYSRTKADGTEALRSAAPDGTVPVTILTIHNTYGPRQPRKRFIASVTGALRGGQPVALHYPDRVRDFVFIDDVAAALEHSIVTAGSDITEVQVGSGVGTSLRDAALAIARAVGADPALVGTNPSPVADPHPVTVSPDLGGTYGLCTTSFDEGIRRTIEES